jgi:hypothetical protein
MIRFVLSAMAVFVLAAPVAAQPARTIDMYDKEFGVKYIAMWEEGGYWGNGLLAEGGVQMCPMASWHCQVVGEFSIVRFGDFDATYKQFAGGLRLGRLMAPRVRSFFQFQVGFQNDGFDDSNNAFVIMPGGGFNYALTDRLDLQVQLDVPFARYDGETFNQFRLGVGVGLPLNRD